MAHVMELLNNSGGQSGGSNEQWEVVIDKQSDTVAYTAKRRDPKVCTNIHTRVVGFIFKGHLSAVLVLVFVNYFLWFYF